MSNPKTTASASPKPQVYIVISPLEHDGDQFAPGATIELTDAQAAPLLGHTVTPAPKAAAEAPQA